MQESLTAARASNKGQYAGKAETAFVKMQALGNDFVVVCHKDLESIPAAFWPSGAWQGAISILAKALCDRHFGIGADGLIVVKPAQAPDCRLSWCYVNSDGSPAAMCGNGLRCLALYAVERSLVVPPEFKIETGSGIVAVSFGGSDEITVDLGQPLLKSTDIPFAGPARQKVYREHLSAAGKDLSITCLSMGNPHCVVFEPPCGTDEFAQLAAAIQALPLFPQGVNVEFALPVSRSRVRVFVWERGCGYTLSCATGAAAVLVAGVLEERLERQATIELPGGRLSVQWSGSDNHVRLTGPARQSFAGHIDLAPLLARVAQL